MNKFILVKNKYYNINAIETLSFGKYVNEDKVIYFISINDDKIRMTNKIEFNEIKRNFINAIGKENIYE